MASTERSGRSYARRLCKILNNKYEYNKLEM